MKPEPRHVGGLDCFEVLARLSDYLDGELDPVEKAQVEEHVRGCDWCERFGGEMGGLVHELRRQMAEPEPLEGGFLDRLGI